MALKTLVRISFTSVSCCKICNIYLDYQTFNVKSVAREYLRPMHTIQGATRVSVLGHLTNGLFHSMHR